MSDVLIVNGFTRRVSCNRRGRFFVDGHLVEFESEADTFRALAEKYLRGVLKEVPSPGTDHPVFSVDAPSHEPSFNIDGEWSGKAVLLPAQQGGS